ncbi:MAG: mannose-1-phosphate guanylyltransferase/mannose-6-phosphate isomerase [Halobacteriovoraceae bacterium]|nr:mannose-1-phosphate guanylyltransferase/mannose-6-phosphate isomerase [Halobacteriovoraceae bacterium]
MKAVILCGGSGTRLWPISRKKTPKQFFRLFGNKSLFELTIERNQDLVDGFIIVVNEAQLEICKSQIPSNLNFKIVVETEARNTAPAIALAAMASEPEDELIVLPSDHLIENSEKYRTNMKLAQKFSESLVTFGITPLYPETGFGYIHANGNDVQAFKEKPDLKTAQEYLKSGEYFWNSGMFYFKASCFLAELKNYRPDIFEKTQKAYQARQTDNNTSLIPSSLMKEIPKESIDYAVMENSQKVKVVSTQFQWSDLGSFDAVYDNLEKDSQGNTQAEGTIHQDSKNNLVISNKRLITTFNVEDLIIVDTDDALLIGKRGSSQKVKDIYHQVESLDPKLLD